MARIVARRTTDFGGQVQGGDQDIVQLPNAVVGRHVSYAGIEPVLFPLHP
jgi:putative ABC transport system ATP-binding protein